MYARKLAFALFDLQPEIKDPQRVRGYEKSRLRTPVIFAPDSDSCYTVIFLSRAPYGATTPGANEVD